MMSEKITQFPLPTEAAQLDPALLQAASTEDRQRLEALRDTLSCAIRARRDHEIKIYTGLTMSFETQVSAEERWMAALLLHPPSQAFWKDHAAVLDVSVDAAKRNDLVHVARALGQLEARTVIPCQERLDQIDLVCWLRQTQGEYALLGPNLDSGWFGEFIEDMSHVEVAAVHDMRLEGESDGTDYENDDNLEHFIEDDDAALTILMLKDPNTTQAQFVQLFYAWLERRGAWAQTTLDRLLPLLQAIHTGAAAAYRSELQEVNTAPSGPGKEY